MLRITLHEKNDASVFQLEGRLAGPWVAILRDCWERELAQKRSNSIQLDLCDVTCVDAAGKALLMEMSRQNARFIAKDCQMKAIVEEIVPSTVAS